MKHENGKAYAFRGGAALITAAVLALVALFGMTGCPNNAEKVNNSADPKAPKVVV